MDILVTSHFLDSIPYYERYASAHQIVVEAHETYQKRSLRNKCYLLGPNGIQHFSIPLMKGKNASQLITEVRISYDENWTKQWLKVLQSNYGKSPFYDYIYSDLCSILNKKEKYLYDLNMNFMEWSFSFLGIELNKIKFTNTYQKEYDRTTIEDYRIKSPPVNSLHYPQVFEYKHGFQNNLSILDLLFCTGPEAIIYLQSAGK